MRVTLAIFAVKMVTQTSYLVTGVVGEGGVGPLARSQAIVTCLLLDHLSEAAHYSGNPVYIDLYWVSCFVYAVQSQILDVRFRACGLTILFLFIMSYDCVKLRLLKVYSK